MISGDARTPLSDTEEFAPKRLKRSDVAEIRRLYDMAWRGQREGWEGRLTIFLDRNPMRRAVGKLGAPSACVTVVAKWASSHVLGLDVEIVAHTALGDQYRDDKLQVAKHRFRASSRRTAFCREISHATRLGLGWARYESTTLKYLLRD